MELVGKFAAPDALPALTRARWVAALHHEPLDVTVEERVVVVAGRREREKVVRRARRRVAHEFQLEVAERSVQHNRHGTPRTAEHSVADPSPPASPRAALAAAASAPRREGRSPRVQDGGRRSALEERGGRECPSSREGRCAPSPWAAAGRVRDRAPDQARGRRRDRDCTATSRPHAPPPSSSGSCTTAVVPVAQSWRGARGVADAAAGGRVRGVRAGHARSPDTWAPPPAPHVARARARRTT
mmetsp:Transcript_1214/g.3968  ORF Transcript_1214/g.3968 Transcript_1214/m.3968 type:complete len:243 (-) Transcript_1214:105-833(-)